MAMVKIKIVKSKVEVIVNTLNTLNAMNNQINGISPKDRNIGKYMHAARGIAKYLDNQITDEILYWNCK